MNQSFARAPFRSIAYCAVVALLLGLGGGASLRAADKATAKPAQKSPPAAPAASGSGSANPALTQFQQKISPILQEHCYECHGDGAKKAGLAFDELTTADQILHNPQLWLKVLRNTRSHIMPPPENPPPTPAEQLALEQWIKTEAFGLNPAQPDPGRVTIRRLNRTEYHNTLRDLIGVDFDADAALPPDDVGYGFDNIGDVLSLSPMRMEKFIEAAIAAVAKGVPMETYAMVVQNAFTKDFVTEGTTNDADRMSFYETRKVTRRFQAKVAGEYRIILNAKVDGQARPDPQSVRVTGTSEGKEFFREEYKWADADYYTEARTVQWEAGEHDVTFGTEPLDPSLKPLPARMDYRILGVTVEGPLDRTKWLHPEGYARLYSRENPPTDAAGRRAYAQEVLARFAGRAYRRPADAATVQRLVDLAEKTYSLPGSTFEKGIAQAIVAIIASPRFLFHLEESEPLVAGQKFANVDEYTLASRLSYALWASMPDDELTRLAERHELRKNFRAQVTRLLADPKAVAFGENFAGQWLQSRGVLNVPINSADIMALEAPPAPPPAPVIANVSAETPPSAAAVPAAAAGAPVVVAEAAAAPARFGGGAAGAAGGAGGNFQRPGRGRRGPPPITGTALTPEARAAMKQEAEVYFNYIVREDRSVLELLDSNYTFVNDQLAAVYGIPNIAGPEMRRITLPPDSLRGGVLTMGSVLSVTSNPTRTSPVKRGRWVIENILGSPSAPPPPNIPALEDSESKAGGGKVPTQRELLALHRADPLCASCHSRMDPLGLALEDFNAFGRVRSNERGQPIDPAGELVTGEKFSSIRGLKQALVKNHRAEFYRTLTEKLLTYTLGRGVEYYDVVTEDAVIARLEQEGGRFSALLLGVLESAPFQQRRLQANPLPADTGAKAAATASNP